MEARGHWNWVGRAGGASLVGFWMMVSLGTWAAEGVGEAAVAAWAIHDPERPLPPVVAPGDFAGRDEPGRAPADARMLFGGADLSLWQAKDGGASAWTVADGWVEIVPGAGDIQTKEAFGDCQLHIEWATPNPPTEEGQRRGNSGVYLMGLYEIQVLDSHENPTYADGMAGAVYGQFPPLANACLPAGEWQAFDIVFRRPRFDAQGALISPARATVFHNGVLVQDRVELTGPTAYQQRPPYEAHADRLPLRLQNHGDGMRFRGIWIRDLESDGG